MSTIHVRIKGPNQRSMSVSKVPITNNRIKIGVLQNWF